MRNVATGLTVRGVPRTSRCEPAWQFDMIMPDHDLWCVLSGLGEYRVDGARLELRPGVCVVSPPGAVVSARQDERAPLSVYYCHFDRVPPLDRVWTTQVSAVTTLHELCNTSVRCGLWNSPPLIKSSLRVLLDWLGLQNELSHHPSFMPDAVIDDLVTRISLDPGHNWTVDMLARKARLSSSQLNRRFRRRVGVSPREFVIGQRIARAAELLRSSAMSVKQVASALGYTDEFYFSRQFRQVQGHSPLQYRRTATGGGRTSTV